MPQKEKRNVLKHMITKNNTILSRDTVAIIKVRGRGAT